MRQTILLVVVAAVVGAGGYWVYQKKQAAEPAAETVLLPGTPVGATLLPGLGEYEHKITTSKAETQRWFNQGLMLTFGFNHDAAERSFLKAAELDPACAMCWWGAALVLGPHVNSAMDPANNDKAWARVEKARELAVQGDPVERAYIQALSARYAKNPPTDRKSLDQAYAKAAGELAKAHPDDLDAATLHAEALMDLQPWDYYDDQFQPKGGTAEIVATLESVMKRNPEHAGALHLYVHAVEASSDPQRGVAAADRLRELIPGSGHLVHMPAHIYARVGRWHDAAIANRKAIESDNAYLSTCQPQPGVYPLGYVPHNHHFLWFAATMEGDSETALSSAEETAIRTNIKELIREPGFAALQYYALTPLFARVRFGRWDEVVATPKPPDDLPYQVAIWNYAQGMAAVRQQRFDAAQTHLEDLTRAGADPAINKLLVWDRYPLSDGVKIAKLTLEGEIAAAKQDYDPAIAALTGATKIEDGLLYDEPPAWHAPVRQTLGAVLLDAKKPAEAEEVYREELRRNPENGWSLFGLERSLVAQGRKADAKAVSRRLESAWKNADVKLEASRL